MQKILACAVACTACLYGTTAWGHGFAGQRFFPPTVTTEDPFATDELSLNASYVKNAAGKDDPSSHEFDGEAEFSKLIFPRFALSIGVGHATENPDRGRTASGWENLSLGAKYQLYLNDAHEFVFSVGVEAEIGGTGSLSIERDSFTTFTPTVYFGKGFGDLPDSLGALRPLAITGTIGQTFPTRSASPNTLEWGFAVEYSLPYLQQHVKDIGIPAPFKDMIPLVEFSFETAENRDEGGLTTGTVNPGLLYETPYYQLGVEAIIPVNHRSGSHVGVIVQLQIYIDDLFPHAFGFPVIGESR